MKKRFAVMAMAVASAAALAACSGSEEAAATTAAQASEAAEETTAAGEAEETEAEASEEAGGAESSADGRTVIKFYKQDGGNGAPQALVDAFNNSQDEITVEWVIAPKDSGDVRTQLNTAFGAGSSEYDVVCIDTIWAGDMAGAGYLEALDPYMMDAGLTVADFNSGSIAAGTYSAKTYAIPLYPDFGSLFFRSDIVSEEDAAKLVSGDYTFEDLLAMSETYAGQGGTSVGLAIQAAQYEGLICNVNEWTSNFTDIEHGLELFKTATDADYTPQDILVYREADCNNALANGETVFSRGWPGTWGVLTDETTVSKDQVDIAPLPGGSCIGGWLLAINTYSENKEAAWEFLKYAATDGQIPFCSTGGYVPGYNALVDNEEILAGNELLSKPGFIKALENTIPRPSSSKYSELTDALQISIHKYLSNEGDLAGTVAEVESLLEEYK